MAVSIAAMLLESECLQLHLPLFYFHPGGGTVHCSAQNYLGLKETEKKKLSALNNSNLTKKCCEAPN